MRVLIADDHRLVVEGVRLKLTELGSDTRFSVATTVAELQTALRQPPPPDLALIDLAMPGAQNSDYRHITAAMRTHPNMRVMVLSGCEDHTLMHKLIDLGVHGFIPKAYSSDVMLSAVKLVLSGGTYVPPMALAQSSHAAGSEGSTDTSQDEDLSRLLTERQSDVLKLLSRGSPNKIIARELGISEGTVKIHLAAIFRILNVRNRVEAVVASQKLGGT
jgi:DNA-binding NarL/FixJ family response regulator